MKYEICYLVGESNDPRLAEIKAGVEKIIMDEMGVFSGIETMDRRKLAYKVEKDIRGMFVTRRFELPEREEDEDPSTDSTSSPQAGSGQERNPINEMTKKLNLYADILRFLIIKADKLPELKQREIPVKAEKTERRYDRSRSNSQAPVRRTFAPRTENKASTEAKALADKPEVKAPEVSAAETKAKEESIDQKLNELLNI